MAISNLNLTNQNLTTIKRLMYSRLDTLFQKINNGDGTNSENKSKLGNSEPQEEE